MTKEKRYDWHRHHHVRMLTSYRPLSAEQRGVAYTLLDLIYDKQGPIPESDQSLAAAMNMGVRRFRRIKKELVEMSKFSLTEEGFLTNKRAEEELLAVRSLSEVRAKSARQLSGKKSGNQKKPKENSGSDVANAEQKLDFCIQDNKRLERGSNDPSGSITTSLPPDGALAFESLRASCGSSAHLHQELDKLENCLAGWREGVLVVGSRWAKDHFTESLRQPLRASSLTIDLKPPAERKSK
jgi:uncharacterized protein YdaU (DUF1376 family)